MKLTFLGSGSAFTMDGNYHSNMVLENDEKKSLLIDCGSDVRFSLHERDLSYRDIHSVYVSHLHADHIGGLEWLAFTTKFDPEAEKPNLFISENLIDQLWDHTLSGGLTSLQNETATLSSYFQLHPIKGEDFFTWEKLEIKLIKTLHIISGKTIIPSYGLFFTANGITVFITTDTQYCPDQLHEFYERADIIFHDCEIAAIKSHVHAHYDQLITLPMHIKNKIWLYHYNPCKLPNAKQEGFRGFVVKGQCFDFKDSSTLR